MFGPGVADGGARVRLAILFFFWSPLLIGGARLRAMSIVGQSRHL